MEYKIYIVPGVMYYFHMFTSYITSNFLLFHEKETKTSKSVGIIFFHSGILNNHDAYIHGCDY